MIDIALLYNAFSSEVVRTITGRLFSEEQVRTLTRSAIGKYLAEFLPEPADERTAKERVEEARLHIGKASQIIASMQGELSQQSTQLDKLLLEIEEKKKLAEKYGHLASTNQQLFAALRSEMEESLRKELVAQADKGRRLRQAASATLWLVTLILGAWLGTYFKEVSAWVRELLGMAHI